MFTFETSACEANRQSYHVSLAPGAVRHLVFRADQKMLVSFMHQGDPKTAMSCHGRPNANARSPMKHCAGIYESDGKKIKMAGNSAEGVYGGAVSFEPLDGKITVALKNLSIVELSFVIEAMPRKGCTGDDGANGVISALRRQERPPRRNLLTKESKRLAVARPRSMVEYSSVCLARSKTGVFPAIQPQHSNGIRIGFQHGLLSSLDPELFVRK